MKQILRCMVGLMAVVTPMSSYAFIYNITVLKKWDPVRNRDHYFIGCGDFHDKKHRSTGEQSKKIHDYLRKCARAKNTKVIVEDLSSSSSTGSTSCGSYTINSRGGILGGLTQKCKNIGVSAENVEYRYCRVVALSPALKNLGVNPRDLASVRDTPLSSITNEIEAVITEVNNYDDGKVLNKHYQNGIRTIANKLQKLKFKRNGNASVADYLIATTDAKNKLDFIKLLLTFDSGLLDLKMVHFVANALDKERVIAFAGGSHIKRAVEILQECGYKMVYSSDEQFSREYNLKKCLGSNIVGGKYCVKPHSLDLDLLSKY
jgi:hypothetical protein